MYYTLYTWILNLISMNHRQTKKRKKYYFYLGVAAGVLHKFEELKQKGQLYEPMCITIKPELVTVGHNQHGFCKVASFGKSIIKKYSI